MLFDESKAILGNKSEQNQKKQYTQLSLLESLDSFEEIERMLLAHGIFLEDIKGVQRPKIFKQMDGALFVLFLLEGIFMQDIVDFFAMKVFIDDEETDIRSFLYNQKRKIPKKIREKIERVRKNKELLLYRYSERDPVFANSLDTIIRFTQLKIEQIFLHIPAIFMAGSDISFVTSCNALASRIKGKHWKNRLSGNRERSQLNLEKYFRRKVLDLIT